MLREAALVVAGLTILAYSIEFLFNSFDDPREPRRVGSPIPIFGHVIGFLRHGFDYYYITSRRADAEIYTIGVMNFKIYITHATRLTNIIQKTRALSSRPIIRASNRNHSNVSDEAHHLFDGEILDTFSHTGKEALTPSLQLDAQNLRMGEEALTQVTEMLGKQDILLLDWAQHATVQATAAGLYGLEHPFKDPEVEEAMWTWDEHKPGHMLGIDLWGTGYRARTKMYHAFKAYFQKLPDDVSLVIRERQRVLLQAGIPEEDTYKMQSNLSDAYPNFPPTLFWTIYEIYSRPDVLQSIRSELLAKAVMTSPEGESTLDVTALQTDCHVLLSAFQETQRTRHSQVAFRIVVEDTFLDGYLLKKGNYIHLPAKPVHKNEEFWGENATAFDAYRFVQADAAKEGVTKTKILPSGFRAWGAPPHMCPARQFASTEILIFVALLAMRVDLAPADGTAWVRDPALKSMEIAMLPRPKDDVRLKVMPRKEAKQKWSIVLGKSKTRVPLASG